jgi:6-phosphogluconolactonase/glucosamine-6-phosphate isomerase/deaminase
MELVVCDSTEAFIRSASDWCRDHVASSQAKSIFVPAGRTPIGLYEHWEKVRPDYLRGLRLLQIDDVLTGGQRGVFREFFETHLPGFGAGFQVIETADEIADLALLGLGLNGHVAFHEPGLESSFFSGCVRLSETTCSSLGLEAGTWGLTYGAGAFLRTKGILMMVQGESKRAILSRLLARDPGLPAAALVDHPDFTILADRAACP